MQKDIHISGLKNTDYVVAINANTSNETGDFLNIQNEPSNRFGVLFPDGYKVIGFKNYINKERTLYLLTNPGTMCSSIGYVDNNVEDILNADLSTECPTCNEYNVLGEPLEETTQTPSLTYTELINDDCHIDAGREGLNFDINFPVKKIEVKEEKLGTTFYWNDNRNGKRYLNATNIEENPTTHYLFTQEVPCAPDEIVDCILVDKLLVFPKHNKIQVEAEQLQTGGNLKLGTYEFYAAYCDLLGNEMTNYSTPTNPISIFDENNNILTQTELDVFTNFAIKLKVKNLDSKAFKYYKVVCVERNNVDNRQTAFIEGIHPTTDDTIVYTHSGSSSDENITRGNVSIKRRIDFNKLNLVKPHYDKAKSTMVSGGRLWSLGLTKREEINLQPVVNLFSQFLEWQTTAAKQDLYKSAIATSKYKGYMRNEVQPFGIRFFFKDGDYSAVFPMVGRPANEYDLEEIDDINYESINANTPNCSSNDRNKRWQIFNTASKIETCTSLDEGVSITEIVRKECLIEGVHTIPSGSTTLSLSDDYTNLLDYIEDNPDIDIPEITPSLSYSYISEATSGSLIVGNTYLIQELQSGDDFTNVGYVSENNVFTATGTTPTDWTNSTVVILTFDSEHCIPNFGTVFTTGELVVGANYIIYEIQGADDFSNVGFTTLGEVFEATNTTPTLWASATEVTKTNCDTPELISSENTAVEVVNEVVTKTEADFPTEYQPLPKPEFCNLYVGDFTAGTTEYVDDEEFMYEFMYRDAPILRRFYEVKQRDYNFSHETCFTAEDVIDINNSTISAPSYFHNYRGATALADLQTSKDAIVTTAYFTNKIHRGALWYRVLPNGREKFIFDISKIRDTGSQDDIIRSGVNNDKEVRLSFFNKCSDTTPFFSQIFSLVSDGIMYKIEADYTAETITINDGITTTAPISIPDLFQGGKFFCVLDDPIYDAEGVADWDGTNEQSDPLVAKFRTAPVDGCYGIATRDVIYTEAVVSWDSIIINKTENYESGCLFIIPKVDECDPKPYERGKFSFWESTEEYPDNTQLYDSSILLIKPEDIEDLSDEHKTDFEEYFTESATTDVDGNYVLKTTTDFTCAKIRHPKMPDNTVAPFMYDSDSLQRFTDTVIFPLGVSLDSATVRTMLTVALNNNLITQKEFDNIEGYEILRGDNSIHKSVIANGLGYDMYNYDKSDGEKWWYANFPFNDLGEDKYHVTEKNGDELIQHPFDSEDNYMFSFLSPDVFLTKPALPSEVVLAGYQFGNARESFVNVEDHPKYTILGSKARSLANTLAITEVVLETLIKVGELTSQQWFTIGTSSGASLGLVGAIVAASAYGISGFVKTGQYRYEWLKTFRDLGTAYNFASMNVGVGKYNRFLKTNPEDENYLRGLSVKKYLKNGMFTIVDENDAQRMNINNWLREDSVLLSMGENYPFEYPSEYKSYDNNTVNPSSSKIIASNIECESNLETIRDIASPYFSLKNYIPDQWGTVDSIKWLTTNYIFKLDDDTVCSPILGGTVCISPFSWRRKTPIFRNTGMGLPDKLPYNYSEYNNIAFPRYYIDYEVDTEYSSLILPMPDIDSDYRVDCQRGATKFYLKPPSKFYLYSYGIVDFLVESEINCHFRYARKDPKDWFYPQVSNVADWVQEKNLSITEPNTFYYNNVYSFPVSNTPYKFLDYTYDKEIWRKRNLQPNAVIYSEQDNNENDLNNPWLVFKPANWYEFSTKFGKLIDLKDIESSQFFARFENQLVLHNAIDSLADRITPQNRETGTAGIFAERPLEFKSTDLGFAGTQHTDMCSTPYGHYFVDAKRGKVFQIDQNGKDLQTISEQIGNQPTNMKQWFREHLPFKILKYFPSADIDNKYRGLGMNIWYDDRQSRVFFTKRDYIPKTDCIEYVDEDGFCYTCLNSCDNNLILNGTFETNLAGWTQIGAQGNWVWSAGKARYIGVDEQTKLAQDILEVGKTYNISFDLYRDESLCTEYHNVIVYAGDTTQTITASGNVSIQMTATDNTTFAIQGNDSCGGTPCDCMQIDNVCVYEITDGEPIKVEVTDENYFTDVSWTIAYKPTEGSWVSYYTFYPDYSPAHNGFFQVGYNWGQDAHTLWNHTMNNSSFQVFQGRLNPFYVEFPVQNENVQKMLNSISLKVEAKRFQNQWDFAQDKNVGFNKISLWNNVQHSGVLNLFPQLTMADARNYPKTNSDRTQDISFTAVDGKHNINYFFNRVKQQQNNIPIFLRDANNIFKDVNPQAISFMHKRVLERMVGDEFMVGLTQDKESRFNIILNRSINNETIRE